MRPAALLRTPLPAALLVLAGACSSGSPSTGGNGGGNPSISLAISPGSAAVEQGGSTEIMGSVTRNGGFTGDVTISLIGAPAGVSGTVTAAPTGGNNSVVVTLTVSASASPGADTISVQASGSGVTAVTATFVLTVLAATPAQYTMSANEAAPSVVQGAGTAILLTLARTNFTGAVTLSANGLPSGVTVAFSPDTVSGNGATVTFTAASGAVTGTWPVILRGTANGLADVTVSVSLTVKEAPGFALTLLPAAVTVTAGASDTAAVTARRLGGYGGAIAFSATGVPTGMTVAFAASPVTDSTLIVVTAGSGVAPGTYPVAIHAVGDTIIRDAALSITVTMPAMIRIDYSQCSFDLPVWVAYQDGDGPWTAVTPVGKVWEFPALTSDHGALAEVFGAFPPAYTTDIRYSSRAESAFWSLTCGGGSPSRRISGSVAGLGPLDNVSLGFGGGLNFASAAQPGFMLATNQPGPHDLVAYLRRAAAPGPTDLMIIRRDLDIPDGGSLATLDFGSAEAVAPVANTVTVSGGSGGSLSAYVYYLTGAPCSGNSLYSMSGATSPFTIYLPPPALRRSSDGMQIDLFETDADGSRQALVTSHTPGDVQVSFGSHLGAVTETVLPGSYKRIQLAFTMPADYQAASVSFGQNSVYVDLDASAGFLAGRTNVTLTMPDFAGLSGFQPGYLPSIGSSNAYGLSVSSGALAACTDGVYRSASVSGGN